MLKPTAVFDFMHDYSVTQSAVALAAREAGAEHVSDAVLSNWLRGRTGLSYDTLKCIKIGMSAVANLCHMGYPLDFSSPKIVPLIRKHIATHEQYLRDTDTRCAKRAVRA